METFSALLAIYAGNSPVPGEFPAQRPVMRNLEIFFDLRLNKRLSKQSWGWWFEMLPRPLWRHSNALLSVSWCVLMIVKMTVFWTLEMLRYIAIMIDALSLSTNIVKTSDCKVIFRINK